MRQFLLLKPQFVVLCYGSPSKLIYIQSQKMGKMKYSWLNSEGLRFSNCGAEEDSWEFLGLQGDQTRQF